MPVQSKAWEQVGEKFETLGDHLRGHFDEVGAEASAERAAFEKSVRGLLSALEDGFNVAGKAVRDPALRDDVSSVATSVREALLATFETAGEQVRDRLSRPRPAVGQPTKRVAGVPKPRAGKSVAAKSNGKPVAPRKRPAR